VQDAANAFFLHVITIDFNVFLSIKKLACRLQYLSKAGQQQNALNRLPPHGRSLRMNRQRAAQLRLSPLHFQQGLFGVFALLVTLIAGQQFLRWEQSQQQEAPRVSFQHATQTTSAPPAAV
jgi:hypothetical protein